MTYQHGRFVWFECYSNDPDQARVFYSELFGWTIEPMQMSNGQSYQLIKSGDTGIGGLMKLQSDQGEHPFWLSYISVSDVDATTTKISKGGGAVFAPPFAVPGVGRMAVVRDPQGATFALFKGETEDPSEAEGPGAWWWNELWTSDHQDAVQFYEDVFGYTHDQMPMPDGTYFILKQGDQPRGGVMHSPSPEVPPNWLPYVRITNCDETAARAEGLGAKIAWPPTDIPSIGRFTVLHDPTGTPIAAIQPANAD